MILLLQFSLLHILLSSNLSFEVRLLTTNFFHSFYGCCFHFIAWSTSLFHHHVTLYLDGPLVHPQILSATLSESSLRDFHKSPTWSSTLTLCVTCSKTLAKFYLTSHQFNFQTHLFRTKGCFSTSQRFIFTSETTLWR